MKKREYINIYVGGEIIDQWGTFKRNKRDIEKEIVFGGDEFILVKNFDFYYNKALIYQNKNNINNYILISYNTCVCEINGDELILYGYFSQTTKKHIDTFLRYFGIDSLSKKELLEKTYKILNIKKDMKILGGV